MARLDWRNWEDVEQRQEGEAAKPLLLLIGAPWCRHTGHLEACVLEESPSADALAERFFLVRVDREQQPEVAQRYAGTAWPAVAIVRSDLEPWATVSNLADESIQSFLAVVLERWSEGQPEATSLLEFRPDPPAEDEDSTFSSKIVSEVAHIMLESFDGKDGGFGTGQKFPHPEVLDFAILNYAKTSDAAYSQVVHKTLSAMSRGGLFDPVSGGFFRYCGTRDWRQPDTEMRLEIQSGLLRNYLEASQLLDRNEFRRVAQKVVSCIEHGLRDPETGIWRGSRDADDAFYSLGETERADRKPPRIEGLSYTSSVAMTVSSLFKAARVLDESVLSDRAREALHFLLDHCYVPGKGMYHSWDGNPQILGLLPDQLYMARALLHAMQYTGDNSYLSIAEDLIETFGAKESSAHGGFYDVAEDDARFAQVRGRNTTILENGLAAEVLLRAYYLTGHEDYRDCARRTLEAFAKDFKKYGYHSAAYGRSVELFFHDPMQVIVLGAKDDPRCSELLGAAQRTYVSSKIVIAIDPATEPELLERLRLPVRDGSRAFVALEHGFAAECSDPAELSAAMMAVESQRS